jgi:membrane protein implicated in regulation of membrane protease activity
MFGIKVLAFLACVLVVYLYWTSLRERLEKRRQRRWLEDKRRELKEKAARKAEPPRAP